MGVFVTVHMSEERPGLDSEWTFEIRSRPRVGDLLVADYALVDLGSGHDVLTVENYPKCTETGLTLFLRMLKQPACQILSTPAKGSVSVQVQMGNDLSMALEREVLQISINKAVLFVALLSPGGLVAGKRIPFQGARRTVREAICLSMGGALGWGELLPEAPTPLSSVCLRKTIGGSEYVCLSDVPPIPRQYLQRHFVQSADDRTLPATLWRQFLQQCACTLPGVEVEESRLLIHFRGSGPDGARLCS